MTPRKFTDFPDHARARMAAAALTSAAAFIASAAGHLQTDTTATLDASAQQMTAIVDTVTDALVDTLQAEEDYREATQGTDMRGILQAGQALVDARDALHDATLAAEAALETAWENAAAAWAVAKVMAGLDDLAEGFSFTPTEPI